MLERLIGVRWERLFVPSTPLLEIVIRGSLTYLAIFALLRLVMKREAAALKITDLLVVVLIADAAQNAMADSYHSLTDGFVLVTTIVAWSYALEWLGYHSSRIQRFIHPPELPLVKDGRLLRQNMRRELLTEDELMTALRQQQIEDIAKIKVAYMEADGRISVIPAPQEPGNTQANGRAG